MHGQFRAPGKMYESVLCIVLWAFSAGYEKERNGNFEKKMGCFFDKCSYRRVIVRFGGRRVLLA